ncbi:hypothetical protein [Pseudomonas anguilliseptica]|uniref:hypothetical protein n=1 Tax=Pseudomonas anguilliseptica TaxID=53406 RepID=UPI000B8103C3
MTLMFLDQLQQLLDILRLYASVRVIDQFHCTKYQAHTDSLIQPTLLAGVDNYRLAHDETPC